MPGMATHLIVQGHEVETADLKALAKLTGAARIEQITSYAFRLVRARPEEAATAYCASARLDCAFVPEDLKLAHFRLAVMDMDSTLITIETIDEIADMLGLKGRVAEITAAAMRGEIDYAASLRERAALLAGLDEGALRRVYEERLRLSPGAERLVAALRHLGVRTLLVSGGFTYFTDRLQLRLAIDETCSNTLEIRDGRLTGRVVGDIVDAAGKRAALERTRSALGIAREQVIGIGDGANDLEFLAAAGVSVAYHAKPVVRSRATYALDYVGLDGILNLFG